MTGVKCLLIYMTVWTLGLIFSEASKVQMRIIHETANYGYFANNLGEAEPQVQLVARVKPANFSGPLLLKKLIGHCYNITIDRYRYCLCPFANITQHEVSLRWNAYQGVLGVWSHWKIENNTFKSMIYTFGDTCDGVDRSVEVLLQCGPQNAVVNVTEPNRCQYMAVFATRLVCHEDSLLVYPRLNSQFQKQWDKLWTDYKYGYLTEKGYNSSLQKLLVAAGLSRPIQATEFSEQNDVSTSSTDHFSDLEKCNKEYEKLKKEIVQLNEEKETLKVMLDLNKILNRTRKNSRS